MKKFGLLLAALLLLTLFFGLGSYGLIDPDEGRYSEIPREMIETGDFITPRLNYVKYFEKPVLHYWLTAAAFAALGQNEFASRLVPALCSLGGVWLVFVLARRRWGADAGVYSAVVLSSGLLWFAVARFNITDMTVSFFITLSAAGFWLACGGESTDAGNKENQSLRYLLLFYAGMALATLSKGLIGIVLPGGVVFWYIVLTRRWNLIKMTLFYWPGIALFFLLCVPWFWAVCRANDDFFYFFFVQEHFLRYATRMHERYQPFWFFIPILILGLIPWAGLLPDMFLRVRDARRGSKDNAGDSFRLFLLVWFAVPFIFFSVSSSKLVPYIVPCLPPLAVLGGRILSDIAEGDRGKAVRLTALNAAVALILLLAGLVYPFMDKKYGLALYPYVIPAVSGLALFAACGCVMFRRGSYRRMVNALCVLAFLNAFLFARGFNMAAGGQSYKDVSAMIRAEVKAADVVVSYGETAQGLGFYLARRLVLVNGAGELEFGARREKDPGWFIDNAALKKLWEGKDRVFMVADLRRLEELVSLLGKRNIIEVGQTRSDVVLSNF